MTIPLTHKAANIRWLSAIALLDAAVLAIVAGFPALNRLTADVAPQLTSAILLPPIVLWLCSLIGPDLKHRLVFWRWNEVLPGHRAFSIHATEDPRFDAADLRKKIGPFPEAARDQNARWYKLYKEVQDAAPVVDAHRSFLLFRDLAAMSSILVIAVTLIFTLVGLDWHKAATAAVILAIQFLLAVVASRVSANRFVRNVLAEHAVR